jgi:hypothetical protein
MNVKSVYLELAVERPGHVCRRKEVNWVGSWEMESFLEVRRQALAHLLGVNVLQISVHWFPLKCPDIRRVEEYLKSTMAVHNTS